MKEKEEDLSTLSRRVILLEDEVQLINYKATFTHARNARPADMLI